MTELTGRCLCGAVRFAVEEAEPEFHACHCSMCRRWSSGPLLVALAKGVEFDGEENIARYNSSSWGQRGFCKHCGTNLFYRHKTADEYYVSVGAFDDPSAFHLSGEIYVDHKPEGYAFAGDHPRLTEEEALALFTQS